MFKKLRTVIYTTKDLPATREWYIKATGQQPYFDQPFYAGFDINGFELGPDPMHLRVRVIKPFFTGWLTIQMRL